MRSKVLASRYTGVLDVVTLPRLKARRIKAALSQRALAEAADVAASTVARIEKGGEVYPSTVGKLAKVLKCEPSDLMEPEV